MILFRRPMFPLTTLRPLFDCKSLEEIDSYLLSLISDPRVTEVFTLSKFDYWNELQRRLRQNPASISEFRPSLLRYLDRMCFRTSTYQAFSAVALPDLGDFEVHRFRRISDLFAEYLARPVEACRFQRNPTFWTDGRSVFTWSFKNKSVAGRPSYEPRFYSVDTQTAAIFIRLGTQIKTFQELVRFFQRFKFQSGESLVKTVKDLIDQELLVYAPGFFPRALSRELGELRFDDQSIGVPEAPVKQQLFSQVFSHESAEFPVSVSVLQDAREFIELLNFVEYEKWPTWLNLIKEDFLRQFPSTNVDFLEAIQKLDLNLRKKEIDQEIQEELENYLQGLIETGEDDQVLVLSIDHKEKLRKLLKKLQIRRESSWSYMSLVVKDDDKGVWPKLTLCGGANRFLGMYGLYSERVSRDVEERWAREKALVSPAVFAEVLNKIDVPANDFSQRLSYADYDIPVLAQSHLPPEKQLPLSDLLLSCVENRFILHSRKLKQEVIPVASHKLVAAVAHPVERFLLNIGTQNQIAGMSWGWERMIRRDFYPRVVYHGVVLSPKKWALSSSFLKKHLDRDDLWEFLNARFGIERHVQHLDHDRPTAIDFGSLASRVVLGKLCDNFERLIFAEEFGFRIRSDQKYVQEFLVPLDGAAPKLLKRSFPLVDEFSPEPVTSVAGIHVQIEAKWYSLVLSDVLPHVVSHIQLLFKPTHWFYLMYTAADPEIRVRFFGVKSEHVGELVRTFSEAFDERLSHVMKSLQVVPYRRSGRHYGGRRGNELYEMFSHFDSIAGLSFHAVNFSAPPEPLLKNPEGMRFERETLWFLASAQSYLNSFRERGLPEQDVQRILRHRNYQWRAAAESGTDFSAIHRYFRVNRQALLDFLFRDDTAGIDFLSSCQRALRIRTEASSDLVSELLGHTLSDPGAIDVPHFIFRLIHMSKVRISLKLTLDIESLLLDLLADLHEQERFKRSAHSKS